MEAGKSGYVIFSASNSYGHQMEARIGWEEVYDIETAKSVLTITSFEGRNNYGGFWYPTGTLKVNGETLVTMTGTGDATHRFEFDYGGETWSALKSWHGGSLPPWESSEIAHNADGSKNVSVSLTMSMWKDSTTGGTVKFSDSKTIALTTIPRASSLTAANGTLGTKQTLTVEKAVDSFTHTIRYECGSASGTICTESAAESIDFTPPLSLASQNTSGTSVSVKLILQTYSGETAIGSAVTKTVTMAIPATVKPTLKMAVSDFTDYSGVYGTYVKGLSRLKIDLTPTISYGSEIASCKVTANGSTYSAKSNITDVLKSSGTLTITATVTDKRGRTSDAVSEKITVLDYTAPAISKLTASRCDEDGTLNDRGGYFLVTFSAEVTPLKDLNGALYTVLYRKASAPAWEKSEMLSDLTNVYSVTEQTYIFPAEDAPYVIGVSAQDNHSAITRTVPGAVAFYLIRPHAGGRGLGLGMTPIHSDGLDLGFPQYMNGNKLTGLPDPEEDNDAVPKSYVDNGFAQKDSLGSYLNSVLPYYTGDAIISADDLLVPTALIDLTSDYNSELYNLFSGSGGIIHAYVITLFWPSVSVSSSRMQIALSYYQPARMAIRTFFNGNWTAWNHPGFDVSEAYHALFRKIDGVAQYLNPPIFFGAEYCTLERYGGQPVYTKLVNLGTLPSSATKTVGHGLSGVTVVRYQAFADNGSLVQEFPFHNTAGAIVGKVYYSADGVKVITYDDLSAYTGTVQLWYTK